jgi:hypothetical protein
MNMARRTVTIERQVEKPVQAPPQTCPHHWLIEPAVGPTSKGVCKICGSVKIFMNIVDDTQPKEIENKISTHEEEEAEAEEDEDSDAED